MITPAPVVNPVEPYIVAPESDDEPEVSNRGENPHSRHPERSYVTLILPRGTFLRDVMGLTAIGVESAGRVRDEISALLDGRGR